MVIELFVIAFLLWESIEDIKTQNLEVRILAVFGALAVLLEIVYVQGDFVDVILGAATGLIALLAAWVTKEAIGYGDGVVMLIMGICCGINSMLRAFMLAVVALSLISMVMMARKGMQFNLRIPFIPCLFVGYVGGLLL